MNLRILWIHQVTNGIFSTYKEEKMKINLIIIIFFIFFIYGCANASNLELKAKTETQELNQVSAIGTAIGSIPPDFVVVSTEGKAVRLSKFIENKTPVIVYFMATWCPWCAKDYVALSKVYKEYENQVSVLSISLDLGEDLNTLREYKKKYPELQKTIFAPGQTEILVNYRITKTTTKYAIDKDGKIIYAGYGAFDEEQWKTLFDKLSK